MQNRIQLTKRFWFFYTLAWIPYALSYIAVFIAQGFTGFSNVFFAMSRNIVSAAILGLFIIWICNRIDWSLHRRIWFFPLHILFSILFSVVWAIVLFTSFSVMNYINTGKWMFSAFVNNALQWQIFTGVMIYATVASIIYVLQVVQNLREEERRAARAETLYAQNSLAVLQAQLNPHFLFNTLHTLMALVRYDSAKAEDALEKLAEMLRYSLKDKRDSKDYLVRLEDELHFVENYLEIEKLRFGDRLNIEKSIESNTLDSLLPAFTIQPLVENAIKHGIAPKNISATIFISVRSESDLLKIEISDDGIGSELDKIDKSDGLGINLIREQLSIKYGKKSKFEIDTNPNKGFKVYIEIPLQMAQKQIKGKRF